MPIPFLYPLKRRFLLPFVVLLLLSGCGQAAIAQHPQKTPVPPGRITEFALPTTTSSPTGIIAGPDGNLWFTELTGQIGRITLKGQITEFLVPTAMSGPAGIASGPDGDLWFAEESANQIGRITPKGQITEFPVPTAASNPQGITAGPDGNLWFTEYGRNQIGRITTGK